MTNGTNSYLVWAEKIEMAAEFKMKILLLDDFRFNWVI
jgi:hypothetical protein